MSNILVDISRQLADETNGLTFSEPVFHIYNPLIYARVPHEIYLQRYGQKKKEILLVGMNPGPFGMAQTGVPFGDVKMVSEFLGIDGAVTPPKNTHPKRPVDGFSCTRSEVSGTRLWGWVRDRFETPNNFFTRFFVANYCPLVFMEASGKNRTPDKLPQKEQTALFNVCDKALAATVDALDIQIVVGVGAFAENRCRAALKDTPVKIARILHPSPASPVANRGWAEQAEKQMKTLGVLD